jgi:hypothetical protein
MKARSDSSFPSAATLENFGSKPKLVKTVMDFCQDRTGYEDIVLLCAKYAPRVNKASDVPGSAGKTMGEVYLMKSGRFYKLGRSNAAGRREYEVAIQLPQKLRTIHVIRTDDAPGIEAYWHNRFDPKRQNGE